MNNTNKWVFGVIVALLLVGALAYAYGFGGASESTGKPMGKIAAGRCSDEYIPVCGNNGITYGNACMAQEVGVAYEGKCLTADPDAICTMQYAPVCGIDGKTYSNSCIAERVNGVKVSYDGECNASNNSANGAAGGTYLAGESPQNASDEELAAS